MTILHGEPCKTMHSKLAFFYTGSLSWRKRALLSDRFVRSGMVYIQLILTEDLKVVYTSLLIIFSFVRILRERRVYSCPSHREAQSFWSLKPCCIWNYSQVVHSLTPSVWHQQGKNAAVESCVSVLFWFFQMLFNFRAKKRYRSRSRLSSKSSDFHFFESTNDRMHNICWSHVTGVVQKKQCATSSALLAAIFSVQKATTWSLQANSAKLKIKTSSALFRNLYFGCFKNWLWPGAYHRPWEKTLCLKVYVFRGGLSLCSFMHTVFASCF